ncbi:MAG: NADP-dependent oxidoreductase [Pseudomonadota bacterium]
MSVNRQFLLQARPEGPIKHSDFKLFEGALPEINEGEVLVQVLLVALEPAMKGWMEARVDYVAPMQIGDVMRGRGLGRVIESDNTAFPEGTLVMGGFGWQEYAASRGVDLTILPEGITPEAAMNVLGITGLTAYFGMMDIGKPEAGETVLVSGAAGATGSVAGQLAHLSGARVVGIAGGRVKCDWLVDDLGFAGAIDYKAGELAEQLKALAPDGVNVFFDNVGGDILDLGLENIADRARVVLCGGISRYNETGPLAGPKNYFNLIYRRARMEGFIVIDYAKRFPEASSYLVDHLRSGELKHHETVLDGFEQLPQALMDLFTGGNIGKQLVRVAD